MYCVYEIKPSFLLYIFNAISDLYTVQIGRGALGMELLFDFYLADVLAELDFCEFFRSIYR